jgi:hypothetical protein
MTFAYDNFRATEIGLTSVYLEWDGNDNASVYWSNDSITYYDIKEFDFINLIAIQPELNINTLYYFNITNSTSSMVITAKTKDVYESNYFFYATTLLIIVISFIVFYLKTYDILFSSMAGFLLLFLCIEMSLTDFPNLFSTFIKTTIITLLLVFSLMLLVGTNVESLGLIDDD